MYYSKKIWIEILTEQLSNHLVVVAVTKIITTPIGQLAKLWLQLKHSHHAEGPDDLAKKKTVTDFG
jgi:hypothetical protein